MPAMPPLVPISGRFQSSVNGQNHFLLQLICGPEGICFTKHFTKHSKWFIINMRLQVQDPSLVDRYGHCVFYSLKFYKMKLIVWSPVRRPYAYFGRQERIHAVDRWSSWRCSSDDAPKEMARDHLQLPGWQANIANITISGHHHWPFLLTGPLTDPFLTVWQRCQLLKSSYSKFLLKRLIRFIFLIRFLARF